ncbi:MAG: Slp family lipoprotein [Nitrospinae bacterium]|nr:Slp family lipoprotein [Nitrospinota bacterium]
MLGLLVLLCAGCAHVISERFRQEAGPALAFSEAFQSPEKYIGGKVVFGGVIVKTVNLPDRAEIEVVQKELDAYGNPSPSDASGGRFIFSKPGYLESEIYSRGREVTGAGKITGVKAGKVDDREYRFPVVEVEELHLWEKKERYYYPPYYWDYFGPPYWGRYWGSYPYWR